MSDSVIVEKVRSDEALPGHVEDVRCFAGNGSREAGW